MFPADKISMTGLPSRDFFHLEGLEFWGKISLLKAGIVYADAVTTVSPTYAQQIQTPEYGMGMEGILKSRRDVLHGILNGVDYDIWDPSTDPQLAATYSPENISGKKKCKRSLILEAALDLSLQNRPLLGIIARMDSQKGFDLLMQILDSILDMDVGLVLLGSGEEQTQEALMKAAARYRGRIGLFFGLDDRLAHRIMAGVDIFLIPSRYEPCGLTQMYALKYGSVPVARATGGLADTIDHFNVKTGKGNGFAFDLYEPKAFFDAVKEAVKTFDKKSIWEKIVAKGMQKDFSCESSAKNYKKLYESVLKE
ncbi:MAG: hypothetical protein DRN37_11915 [Thermoplasmata archaeon]|nr:MAG: hypothetical protein DRN37_11915 [Thermoplasmata archaeon]